MGCFPTSGACFVSTGRIFCFVETLGTGGGISSPSVELPSAPATAGGSPSVGEASGSSVSFKRFSRPSTLFSSASKTSVFGPRFFGTASI